MQWMHWMEECMMEETYESKWQNMADLKMTGAGEAEEIAHVTEAGADQVEEGGLELAAGVGLCQGLVIGEEKGQGLEVDAEIGQNQEIKAGLDLHLEGRIGKGRDRILKKSLAHGTSLHLARSLALVQEINLIQERSQDQGTNQDLGPAVVIDFLNICNVLSFHYCFCRL